MKKSKLIITLLSVLALAACGNKNSSVPFSYSNSFSYNPASSNATTATSTSGPASQAISSYTPPSGESADPVIASNSSVSAKDAESSKTDIESEFSITTEDGNYSQSGSVYTITSAGEYNLSGRLDGGHIVVNASEDDKVTINLCGVSITCSDSYPIDVEEADKCSIKAKSETYNEIIDNRPSGLEDDPTGGAIYACVDLSLAGAGSLYVEGNYNNGIHGKKDVSIKNLTLKVKAKNNAIKGKDSLTIESGELIVISVAGDGLKTEDSDISSKGNQRGMLTISGGTIDIYSCCDGISASYDAVISDEAAIQIHTDTYSSYSDASQMDSQNELYLKMSSSFYSSNYRFAAYFYNDDETSGVFADASYQGQQSSSQGWGPSSGSYYYKLNIPSGYQNIKFYRFLSSQADDSTETYNAVSSGQTINTSRNMYNIYAISNGVLSGNWGTYSTNGREYSAKGIKAYNQISITGGELTIQSTDDAIHANRGETLENGSTGIGDVTIAGGSLVLTSKDDAIHADYQVNIQGGEINIKTAYEGIEGNVITFSGGSTYVYATDDGVNAAGTYLTPNVYVTGGYLDVSVPSGDTDGIDSNGGYTQSGGFVVTRDLTNMSGGMASALDIENSTCTVTGGTIIVAGPTAQTPGNSSQNWVKFGGSSGGWGGPWGGGGSSNKSFTAGTYTISNTSVSFTLSSTYNGMWLSSDELTLSSSYTLSNGTTSYTWTQSSRATTVS